MAGGVRQRRSARAKKKHYTSTKGFNGQIKGPLGMGAVLKSRFLDAAIAVMGTASARDQLRRPWTSSGPLPKLS